MNYSFNILLDLICWSFVSGFHICVYKGYHYRCVCVHHILIRYWYKGFVGLIKCWQDFRGHPVLKTLPSNAEGVGSLLDWRAKIPRALWPKYQNINRSKVVTALYFRGLTLDFCVLLLKLLLCAGFDILSVLLVLWLSSFVMPTSLSQHAECASVYRQSYSPVTPAIYRRDKGVCSALCGARQRVLPHTEKFSFFSYTL